MKKRKFTFVILALTFGKAAVYASAFALPLEECPRPNFPKWAADRDENGTMIAKISFDAYGYARKCEVRDHTLPDDVTIEISKFIVTHWRSYARANKTVQASFTFASFPPSEVRPGSFLGASLPKESSPKAVFKAKSFYDREKGKVTMDVIYNDNGYVANCKIKSSTVSVELAIWTSLFVVNHWRSVTDAGHTVSTTLDVVKD